MGFEEYNQTNKKNKFESVRKNSSTESTSMFPDPKIKEREAKAALAKVK